MFTSLNGFYKGKNDDISWHRHGEAENAFASGRMKNGDGMLLFGRRTYEMMASFWPTDMAERQMPEVAQGMNAAKKAVVSTTLTNAAWEHTTLIRDNAIAEIRRLRERHDITILGSGELVLSLAKESLIDTFAVMVNPVFLTNGTPFLSGLDTSIELELAAQRTFPSGVVLLNYRPA